MHRRNEETEHEWSSATTEDAGAPAFSRQGDGECQKFCVWGEWSRRTGAVKRSPYTIAN